MGVRDETEVRICRGWRLATFKHSSKEEKTMGYGEEMWRGDNEALKLRSSR